MLKNYINKGEGLLKAERRRPVWDVRTEIIGPTMNLDTVGDNEFYLPVTAGGVLLIDRDCLDQIGQKELVV